MYSIIDIIDGLLVLVYRSTVWYRIF